MVYYDCNPWCILYVLIRRHVLSPEMSMRICFLFKKKKRLTLTIIILVFNVVNWLSLLSEIRFMLTTSKLTQYCAVNYGYCSLI